MKKADYHPESEADQTLRSLEHLQAVPDDPWLTTRVEVRLQAAQRPALERNQMVWKLALASVLLVANLLTIFKTQRPAARQQSLDQVVADIYRIRPVESETNVFNF